jgi:hypothetical protein
VRPSAGPTSRTRFPSGRSTSTPLVADARDGGQRLKRSLPHWQVGYRARYVSVGAFMVR